MAQATAPVPTDGVAPVQFRLPLIAAALAGGSVALSLGVYGHVHQATGGTITTFGFPSLLAMKAWLATGAATLALFQLGSALWMYGRLPVGRPPAWLGAAHRWSGTAAFVLTLPVAYHCLWSLGFMDTDARVLAHSLLGCAFYGAFATKLLVLRVAGAPAWALPVAGASLVVLLTGLWLTSALWFFTHIGFPGL